MIQILVTRDFDGQGEESRVITYQMDGYSLPEDNDRLPYAYQDKEIEDSFIGASMFGWDAPVADRAHEWAEEVAAEESAVAALKSFSD